MFLHHFDVAITVKYNSQHETVCVILSAAKDLSPGRAQILRCAQDDSLMIS